MKKSLKEMRFVFKGQITVEECLTGGVNDRNKNIFKELQTSFKK